MRRILLIFVIVPALLACAPRGELTYAPPAPDSSLHDIWVVKFRAAAPRAKTQGTPSRPEGMRFERSTIAVPPRHKTGQIEWPIGPANARFDFVTTQTRSYPSLANFSAQVARADLRNTDTTLLFVHGYNSTHGEAVYQMAQIVHDFEVPSPSVLFSWPSAGKAAGYLYDRDSTLIARDQLEDVIIALTRKADRKLVILGHSMGNLLIMETLRQIEISGSVNISAKIDALFMVSPDIDGELFYAQASRLAHLPDPTVILASKKDRALRVAALLTGRSNRLGSATDRKAVRDLPVSVVDTTDLTTGGLGHNVVFHSPTAITVLKNLRRRGLPGQTLFQHYTKFSDLR